MAIDIKKYEELAKQKQEVHFAFLDDLSKTQASVVNAAANKAHHTVFGKIDCLDCANCCKSLGPRIEQEDIVRISSFLQITASEFVGNYLVMDEEGDFVFKSMPCPFLQEDNKCKIYEARPLACKEYPHTDRNSFFDNLDIAKKNLVVCPAVYEIVEALRKANPAISN